MIRIRKSEDGQFYYVVTGRNGEILVTSETVTRKEKAVKGATALINLILGNEDIEIIDESKTIKLKHNGKEDIKIEFEEPKPTDESNDQLFHKQ